MRALAPRAVPAFLGLALLALTFPAAASPAVDAPSGVATELAGEPAAGAVEDAVSTSAPAVRFAELPNFHKVDEILFRGGQPQPGGVARLKEIGVRSVLNLRWERKQIAAEEAEVEAEGLRYFSIPMYGLVRPHPQQISRALALIDDPENQPLFVHCERGADRTGVVVASYRVARANWTAAEANREALGHGMYRAEVAKRWFVRDLYARLTD